MNVNFVRNLTRDRIRGLLVEFIGGRKRGITPNRIIGQIKSAVKHKILSVNECWEIINNVEEEIKTNTLFPTVSIEKKLERLSLVKIEFEEQIK